jgi:hypothetical protein
MKICQVIFSTNRLEYLIRTLNSQRNLNWEGCTVDKIFIDDFPQGRDDLFLTKLVKMFGYTERYLHKENLGLSVTWSEFWNLIKNRNYDYVWHQEDDVEILQPIRMLDLISLLQQDPNLSQVVLKRQKWYSNEDETKSLPSDWTYNNYRYEKHSLIFSPMASLYGMDRVRFPYKEWYNTHYPDTNLSQINFNEGMVGKALYEEFGVVSGHLKQSTGENLVNHIGEYFVGKRVLPDEPGFENFSHYEPLKKYNSKNGDIW